MFTTFFQGGRKFSRGGFAPPAHRLVTGLVVRLGNAAKTPALLALAA